MTTRTGILAQASQIVNGERDKEYGSPEDNFQRIADLWTAYIGFDFGLTGADVAVMMALVKIARIRGNRPGSLDSWVDLAGYAACGGEIATETEPEGQRHV